MANLTAAEVKAVMDLDDDDITDTNMEKLIDLAINTLNMYGADLSNMSGTAGTKTVGLESTEAGAVYTAVRAVYYGYHKGLESVGAAGLTVSSPDLASNPAVLNVIKEAARQIAELDVSTG